MKPIHYLCIVLLSLSSSAFAQVIDGNPMDSTTITFSSDSLPNFIQDTAATPLWQIGHSRKAFFGLDSTGTPTIITDTINMYPSNANNFFVLKIPHGSPNVIIDFWHKYQTNSGRDGGAVEYSIDAGVTWQSVMGNCNADLYGGAHGIHTSNFYSVVDTLADGTPAFSGVSVGTQFSRLQFFEGFPVRTTVGAGCDWYADTFYVRFLFKSDSVNDSLAGWRIDSVKLEYDDYGSGVKNPFTKPLVITTCPNPSYDGQFTFPEIENEPIATIEVYNSLGLKILQQKYSHSLDLSPYGKGAYFYRVKDGVNNYSGHLLSE